MQLIRETGGVAVLAHPWALKNPVSVIRRLKEAGLHGIEAYRSDGKLAGTISCLRRLLSFISPPHGHSILNLITRDNITYESQFLDYYLSNLALESGLIL